MSNSIDIMGELNNLASERGAKFSLTPVARLTEVQSVPAVKRNGELGEIHPFFIKRQDCIVPDCAKSVLLHAIPLSLYYECVFYQDGKDYRMYGISAIQPDMSEFVVDTFKKHNHFIERANNIRFKRLAVQSGLAEYGRNNITYVEMLDKCEFAGRAGGVSWMCENTDGIRIIQRLNDMSYVMEGAR